MGIRGTVILALLVIVVGAYAWFEEAPSDEPGRSNANLLGEPLTVDPNKPIHHLLDFQPADIVAVHLEANGSTRETKRSGSTWAGASNPTAIDDLLQDLAQLPVLTDIPASPTELRDYGFDPPQSVVRLERRGHAAPLVLQIGNRNPSVTGVYARIGENGSVVLAGALVAWEFDKAYHALGPANEH